MHNVCTALPPDRLISGWNKKKTALFGVIGVQSTSRKSDPLVLGPRLFQPTRKIDAWEPVAWNVSPWRIVYRTICLRRPGTVPGNTRCALACVHGQRRWVWEKTNMLRFVILSFDRPFAPPGRIIRTRRGRIGSGIY